MGTMREAIRMCEGTMDQPRVGTLVVGVDGPGYSPRNPSQEGKITAIKATRWGDLFIIELADGSIEQTQGPFHDPSEKKGIGWYFDPRKGTRRTP
jgi:hypothetical protein